MADRKAPKKAPIPLPGNRDGHQRVQRLEPLAPHPAPKPKPKRKLAEVVKKKESEYAELKQIHRVDPGYEPLSTATRGRATKLVPDTKKGEQTQEARGAHADPELHYDAVNISSHQDHKSLQAKMSGKISNELGGAGQEQTVEVAAENRVRYENVHIRSRQDHGKQTAKAKKIGEEKNNASEEEKTAPPGLTTNIEIHYDDIGLKSRRAHNIKNYVNYDIKDFDDPESKLSENDFHTNCCYAYRKGILTIGITATAVVILVVVFMALVIAGLSQSRENSQEYQELHHMVQSMAEQIVSLEQQLNQSVTSSETTLRQHILNLEEQLSHSVTNLRSEVAAFTTGFNTSLNLTVQRTDFDLNIRAIWKILTQLSGQVNTTKDINSNLEEFADWVTREAIGLNATWNSLQTDEEMLNSSLVQLARLAVPTDCVVFINETVVINTTQACSPSFNLGSQRQYHSVQIACSADVYPALAEVGSGQEITPATSYNVTLNATLIELGSGDVQCECYSETSVISMSLVCSMEITICNV